MKPWKVIPNDDDHITTPWDGHYMLPAFLGCVRWALGHGDITEQFRIATGAPVTTTLESLQAFSDFVAEHVFGKPDDLEDGDDT